jgi:hypothetical protein
VNTACVLLLSLCASLFSGESALDERLRSRDPAVLAQALIDVGRNGASSTTDLEIVREGISSSSSLVRLAAISAATQLQDDAAIPALVWALRSQESSDQDNAHAALTALAGNDIGGRDPAAWQEWHREILEKTSKGVAAVREAMDAGDEVRTRAALHPLLMQRAGKDMVVEVLTDAALHGSPSVAQLARGALSDMESAAAQVAKKTIAQAPSVEARPNYPQPLVKQPAATSAPASPMAVATSTAPRGDSSLLIPIVLVVMALVVGLIIWLLARTPERKAAMEVWTSVFVAKMPRRK